ncbi:MAG: S8 family serine peptidase [Actinomycetota bacterium]
MSSTDRSRARHGRRIAASLAPLLIALGAYAPGASGALTPELQARVDAAAADERIPVVATLHDQVDVEEYAGRRAGLLRALRRTAAGTDVVAADGIDAPVRHFWLVNALAAEVTPAEARELAADPEVDTVDLDTPVRVSAVPTPFPDAGRGDWGVGAVGAPAVWSGYGLTGTGVRVGSIDTGVDPANPDLTGKVVAWRDFVGGESAPYDDNGHGTHTVGTMVGGAAGGAPVGVAPGATVVVAKAMNANGNGNGSTLLAAAQWIADPDGNPATADQPAVVNNSWSASGANDPWFRPMVQKWLALGIVPVFAAGNSGPAAGSVGSPSSYPEVLAVGATAEDGSIAPFSSRGPVVWQDPTGDGPPAGTVLTKPDVVAPGVAVVSTVGSGWLAYSGTSMASPHVAGVVALVKQANPGLAGADLADVVRRTATDVGPAGVDPTFGRGLVNAPAAVAAALGPTPETAFTATPAATVNVRDLRYSVAAVGAGAFRFRIDGGAWSAPVTGTELGITVAEGVHTVEVQAVDDRGVGDPTPAAHEVTVDLTAPTVSIGWRLQGGSVVYTARAGDALSGVDPASYAWRFADGSTAAGTTVTRTLAGGTPLTAELTVSDRAGNTASSTGVAVRARSPLRDVRTTRRVSRRTGALHVRGRVTRTARVIAALEPLTRRQASTAAVRRRAGVAALSATTASGRFRIEVSVRNVAPGRYRLVVTATGADGTPIGAPLVRKVRVTR